MLLSNTAIWQALDDGRLVLDPQPAPRNPEGTSKSPYDSTGVNLTLSNIIKIPPENMALVFDVPAGDVTKTLDKLCDIRELRNDDSYVLKPNQFVLSSTKEFVKLPRIREERWESKPLLAARVEGKSSFARLGMIVHFTAPTIHCGFKGTITLEIICLGPTSVILKPGMEICQLLIETVLDDPVHYVSKFDGQTDPVGVIAKS